MEPDRVGRTAIPSRSKVAISKADRRFIRSFCLGVALNGSALALTERDRFGVSGLQERVSNRAGAVRRGGWGPTTQPSRRGDVALTWGHPWEPEVERTPVAITEREREGLNQRGQAHAA